MHTLHRRMEMIWPTRRNFLQTVEERSEEDMQQSSKETKEESDVVEECLKLVMMDLDSQPKTATHEIFSAEQEKLEKQKKLKQKQSQTITAQKHHQKKCAKCMKLHYIVNILLEGCLMALVKQSLEHIDLLITKMELKSASNRDTFEQYLQHGIHLTEKVDSFYARQDRMFKAFKVLARMRHAKTSQDQIKQGFELLNEMRELNNKFQVSVDNFCNLMAEKAGVEVN